jgi:hypothetical protein
MIKMLILKIIMVMTNESHKGTVYKFILTGFCGLAFAIILEEEFHELLVAKLVFALMGHLSIGLIVIGVLSLIIETDHWENYFRNRLKEIVIDKKYLEGLSEEKLIALQVDALKAYFKDDEIGGKGGFLEFYQKNIQEYFSTPYRSNLQTDIRIDYTDDPDKVSVHETMSWVCKATKGKIQADVKWKPNPGEFESVKDYSIRIVASDIDKTFDKGQLEQWKTETDGFVFPLNKHYSKDGLKVTVTSNVIIQKNKFIAWQMAHPSKGITISVRYPTDFLINKELFGIEDNCDEINEEEYGYYKLTSENWILPNQGIVFELIER